MVKIEVEKTELVWPGKYDENGRLKEVDRVDLPFQIIETINTSRAEREKRKKIGWSLYDFFEPEEGETVEEGWKNKLIWGDNKLVMSSLLKQFANKIDLIYIDPPFATGADFSYATYIGEDELEVTKESSIIEKKAYRDTWGLGITSYLKMLYERLTLMRDLLSKNGSLYVHIDWHVGHYVKIILDEIFGIDNFRSEIIFKRTPGHHLSSGLDVSTDSIYWYSKSDEYIYHQQFQKLTEEEMKKKFPYIEEETGRRFTHEKLEQSSNAYSKGEYRVIQGKKIKGTIGWRWTQETFDERLKQNPYLIYWTKEGRPRYKRYADEYKGRKIGNLWDDITLIGSNSSESVGYPTQKPEDLMMRIVKQASNKNSIIADFFCGSGTTCVAAEKLNRRWIGCDLSKWAIHITRKRLLEIENCKPFEILNLGKYERQYWQDIQFNKNKEETIIFQYIAFILKLYGAQPISGTKYLHGKKGNAMVHIGSVDSPVTIDEINLCIDECLALKQQELHILGWEWEMGLNELMIKEAKSKGIKLLLLNIPREVMDPQAVEKGDVRFYELAYVDADIQLNDKKAKVILKDFAMSNVDLIPEDVREKITKWSDYIDYWAIDWNFQNDTFMNGWVTYRTRRNRKLELESDIHKYDSPGRYNVLIKVVDIFGNDTSILKEIEVK